MNSHSVQGISLNIEQFTTFLEQLPAIEKALKAKGISVPRPKYGSSFAKEVDEDEDGEDHGEEAAEEEDDLPWAEDVGLDFGKTVA